MTKIALPLLAVALVLPACAARNAPAADPNVRDITIADIEVASPSDADAYRLVEKLRPGWLRHMGRTSLHVRTRTSRPVYLDNILWGSLGSLHWIRAVHVERISFLDSEEASRRFGAGHINGAILVFSRWYGSRPSKRR